MNKKGRTTKNQERFFNPLVHKKFKNQVPISIMIILAMIEKKPIRYPIAIKIEMHPNTKCTNAGVHKFDKKEAIFTETEINIYNIPIFYLLNPFCI